MKLTSFLLPKYLKFDKTQPFIFITTLLAFLGISIGVMVLCVAMAIMNGVSKEFKEKIFVMNSPLNLKSYTKNSIPKELLYRLQIEFPDLIFSPYLQSHAIIKTHYGIFPVVIFGIDEHFESQNNPILAQALNGKKLKDFEVIMGEDFYKSYGVRIAERLTFFFTELSPNAMGFTPIMKRFDVGGFFHSGIRGFDRGYSYTTLSSIAKLRNIDEKHYDGIHINSLNPMKDYEKISAYLNQHYKGIFFLEGWWHQNGNLFSAMELEKRALFIVLLLIILMASLNIISSLLMVIMNRRKEIALLLSMGTSKKEIQKTFFCIGSFIGLSGVFVGLILGGGVMIFLRKFPIISLPADVYGTTKLPLDLSLLDLSLIILGSILIVLLSAYYPARKASTINLLDVLRNE
ncbi:ABC transporter permease [Helicobacter cholecystus]|uniref:ABC transporter permease n=1 Tax=Helicobacter cholecystus TaxID=45498 RepID=UPI00273955FE|nr:ABC transporter permease [Helicobacter cholecystus]